MKKVLVFAGASGYGVKIAYHLGKDCTVLAIADNDSKCKGKIVGGGTTV